MPAFVALLCVGASVGAHAIEPIVRIGLSPETIRLGESSRMQITVLVPTWQPAPPVYPNFEIPNVIIRLPPDSAHPTSERIAGVSWSGVVRNYQVTPLLAADFHLGGESIRITWADPGKPNEVSISAVPIVKLAVRVPDGAADLDPYLAGSEFSIERTVTGDEQPLNVGDALVMEYRATLKGMPAVFIPPLAPELGSNLATAYPEEPEIIQAPVAQRVETVTLILNHGGHLELPAQTFSWWNTNTEQIEQATVEPMTFVISGPPAAGNGFAEQRSSGENPRTLLFALLTTLMVGIALWRWLPGYLAARQRKAERRKQSEAYAFDTVRRTGDPQSAYAAAIKWLNRLEPDLDLRTFAVEFGNSALSAEVDALSRTLFENTGSPVNLRSFIHELGMARDNYLSVGQRATTPLLAPLNPTQS